MFNRILPDVVEIVVVYSKSYDLYLELKEIVAKFKDDRVETRVKHKLVIRYSDDTKIVYMSCHSVDYTKPYFISKQNYYRSPYTEIYKRRKKQGSNDVLFDLPNCATIRGARAYMNRFIDVKGFGDGDDGDDYRFLYKIRNCYFYESGMRIINFTQTDILK